MPKHTIAHYHCNAARFQAQYDSVAAADVHADWASLLQGRTPGRALDVGAGSGRDACWLAQQGWQVTAVEPAQGLRDRGQHTTGDQVQWLDSQLPRLPDLDVPKQGYDLILLSAVWMHLSPSDRSQAFARLVELLSRAGLLIITLRFGPSDPERPMYKVSVNELTQLAQPQGLVLSVLGEGENHDRLARAEVSWQTVCLQAGSQGA